MTSWVYIFSRFTSEALLFEILLFFVLFLGYCSFWILHKRKFGSLDKAIPAGVVRDYLNELIQDAEGLRTQLFGMLAAAGLDQKGEAKEGPKVQVALDAEISKKLSAMEAEMHEQTQAIQSILADKDRIEKLLSSARVSDSAAAKSGSASGDPAIMDSLQEKIKLLESKLAEYSVIEDDLANLKRLQQENNQLRAQLTGKGIEPEVAPATEDQAASEPTAETSADTQADPSTETSAEVPAGEGPEPSFEAPPAEAASESAPEPAVEPVEVSASGQPESAEPAATTEAPLKDQAATASETQEPSAEEPAVAPKVAAASEPKEEKPTAEAAPAEPTSTADSSSDRIDEDLVAEFEKMLNA